MTGTWFLETYLPKWQNTSNSLFWLSGIPGCGKTILSSTITQTLLNTRQPNQAVVYFYFDFSDKEKQSSQGMVRSIILQLLAQSPAIPHALRVRYKSCKTTNQPVTTISTGELLTVLKSMIETFEATSIILDALDECADVAKLLKHILTFANRDLQGLHCLLTSRTETTLHDSSRRAFHLRLEPNIVNDDIRRYIQQVLDKDTAFERWKGQSQAKLIEDKLMKNAAGM
jgi:hypothetical protein